MKHVFSRKLFQSSAPFSHYVEDQGLGFISGIIAQDPTSGLLQAEDFEQQLLGTLNNLRVLLREVGVTEKNVLRICIYLRDYQNFDCLNKLYGAHFSRPYPARTTIAVAGLPLGAKVQIDAVIKLA
ncbi:2-iminobutanoate/2-iminopropanoate deaminase [Pseudidiomarina planktonica]|uniref:2-iminobutanoate/2-iminopropanoate deaminase n=1 Tax=Pseudidiomarina planktonica TaxID=1323738 RepID=A0A1Y6E9A2_9GAMM|nr:RidA family protein [Pseudidiomarina planktonica]RUO66276.1 RidA family protein [Pseudidiomarina planktonica]SMQ59177.1 2-iminobutanoate/2-iminopropanoate deaminase [Pseudidiomarina planktonica]